MGPPALAVPAHRLALHGMGAALAKVVSVVFQPLFIPIYTMVLLFGTETYLTYAITENLRNFIFGVVLINSVFLPMAVFLFLLHRGVVESLHMRNANERTLPFLTVIIFQLSTYFLFKRLPIPDLITQLVLAGAMSVVLALLINLRWKVSIHMLGMGGLVGTFIGMALRYQVDSLHLIMVLTLLSGLVGYARLRLDAHTPGQVYVGWMLGTVLLTSAVALA